MSYHIKKIPKGVLGEFSKIEEEFLEAKDALNQDVSMMVLIELSDMLGAMEHYLKKYNMTIEDLKKMNHVTQRAFSSGRR